MGRREFGFDEEIEESRVRRISARRSQNYFSVTGQFDFAGPVSVVGNRYLADFGILFRRYDDLRVGHDAAVGAPKVGLVFGKGDLVRLRCAAYRLLSGRPDRAAVNITQVNKGPPIVARNIFSPACDGPFRAL